jgi:Fe2+ or Zn2+ uptake regulation protein
MRTIIDNPYVVAMDETTSRILDTLWRETGRPISIRELTSRIRNSHGTAYYTNIYQKIHALAQDGTISLTKAGKSSLANLNFANYLLIDQLAELELKRKHDLLTKSEELQMLFKEIEQRLENIRSIESISAANPERNLKLNRAELLILLHSGKSYNHHEIMEIQRIMRDLWALHNIKLDPLILTTTEFLAFLTDDETNPLKEMIPNAITFHSPQEFWRHIAEILAKGSRIVLSQTETKPGKISEKDLIFNLSRFGYKEMGPEILEGEKICLEYIITSILVMEDARRNDAIPILLTKKKANYSLLIFLSQKYGLLPKLLGLLRALNNIFPKKETMQAIETLEALHTTEKKADQRSIEQKMTLYNAR